MNTEETTELSCVEQGEKTATDYVAEAVINDVELLKTIKKPQSGVLHAALAMSMLNALTEVQTIAYMAQNKDEFYKVNSKYIMILSMYQEILRDKLTRFKKAHLSNHALIEQHSQLFTIMLSKLFSLIKRADIYFEDEKQYTSFKHLLPVQMYIDNVVIPAQTEGKKSKKKD